MRMQIIATPPPIARKAIIMPEIFAYPNWLYILIGFAIGIMIIRFWRTVIGFVVFLVVCAGLYFVFQDRIPTEVNSFVRAALELDNLPAPPSLPTWEVAEQVAPIDDVRPTPTLVPPTTAAAFATVEPTLEAVQFAAIDAHALNAPDSAEQSLDALADYLNSGARNDTERARAIYRWITAEVDYDAEAFFSGDYGLLTPEEVLVEREAICSGYSRLFEALAERMGLESEEVIGYSKGYTSQIGELDDVNHAWNAVQVDGAWQLVDVTWGSGYLDEAGQFVESFNPHYFLTPPEQFINDHYPEEERWQLMGEVISAEKFANSPDLSPAFYKHELELDSHTAAVLSAADRIAVTIQTPPNIIMLASLAQNDNRLDRALTFVQRKGTVTEIIAHFPEAGTYELQLFAKDRNADGEFPYVAGYRIESSGGVADYRFPQQYATFAETDSQLIFPQAGLLQRDNPYTFEISVPTALDVAIIDGENWTFMERTGNTFTATTAVYNPTIQISAQFDPNSRTYSGLLEYQTVP